MKYKTAIKSQKVNGVKKLIKKAEKVIKKNTQKGVPDLVKNHVKMRNERFEKIRDYMNDLTQSGSKKDSFSVFDLKSVEERIQIWRHFLPRVEMFFASKVLFDEEIMKAC